MASRDDITRLLVAHRGGEAAAFDELVPLIYDDLRRIARQQLRRHAPGETLSATALVHEAYFRLVGERGVDWQERGHFFAIAANSMRRILVDYARERGAKKRGGDQVHVELTPELVASAEHAESVLGVEDALSALERFNERLAKVVELRLFAGLSEEETAEVLGVSLRTAQRDWLRARAWLQKEMLRA